MSLCCLRRTAHSLLSSISLSRSPLNLRSIHSLRAKLLDTADMTSRRQARPFGSDDERPEGLGIGQPSGSGLSRRELQNSKPSNLKGREAKDTTQRDGHKPKYKHRGAIQRGGHSNFAGGAGLNNTGRGARGGLSQRGRLANGRGEASGYKTQQQARTSNQDREREVWSVEKEPNVRVDATTTRVLRARDRVKENVQFAVQRMFGTKYRVEYFGSTRYGVSHSHSDLDMVVIDPDYPQGFVKKEFSEPIYKARTLATAMKRTGFVDVDYRARSAVPIVRFKDRVSGIDCDLNVNERLGIVNSDMIKEYCDNSHVLRPMLFSIKEWAKPLLLNSPSGDGVPASFSSYALALMTITFLQNEGLLPNLQADLPTLSSEEENATFVWSQKPRRGWDVRFRRLQDYTPPEEPSVETLLLKWFQFWTNFPYEEKCVSIRHGAFLDRDSPLLSEFLEMKPPSPICVIDPFIRSKNVTTAVSKKVLERFKTECGIAVARMQQPSSSDS